MIVRSETIGSLLRPAYLLDARRRLAQGDLHRRGTSSSSRIAPSTKPLPCRNPRGSTSSPTASMRRYAFFGHLVDALEGFDKSGGWAIPFHDEQGTRAHARSGRSSSRSCDGGGR